MEYLSSYTFVIAASVVVILSYLFNLISKKTNIPSVLLLIFTGFAIQKGLAALGTEEMNLFPILEVLGIVGLIMIVLEAALDLELKREKSGMIWKALGIASLGLFISAGLISTLLYYSMDMEVGNALLYAIPLSIISSAIVLPSIEGLAPEKKEFLIYESTFSDILGIMFFYFLISGLESKSTSELMLSIGGNLVATIAISLVVSYLLVYLFQNIKTKLKLFLLIAVLILLYALGKMLHLSSLLIILVFGLVINNQRVFFKGILRKWLKPIAVKSILTDFKLVTIETAFIVRTFFFVLFGMSISISSLFNVRVFLISTLVVGMIYASRWGIFRTVEGKQMKPQLYIAPRGLITILLFYAIPENLQVGEFDAGILLYVILASSFIMTWSLISNSKKDLFDDVLFDMDLSDNDESKDGQPHSG